MPALTPPSCTVELTFVQPDRTAVRDVIEDVAEQDAYEQAFGASLHTDQDMFVWIYTTERPAPGVLFAKRIAGEWKGMCT